MRTAPVAREKSTFARSHKTIFDINRTSNTTIAYDDQGRHTGRDDKASGGKQCWQLSAQVSEKRTMLARPALSAIA